MRRGRRLPIRTESIVDTITQQQSGAVDVGVVVVRPACAGRQSLPGKDHRGGIYGHQVCIGLLTFVPSDRSTGPGHLLTLAVGARGPA